VHALHPENVRLLPYQPKERLPESLAAPDLHLVPLRRGVYGCLVPSKVYGILAVGLPFVAMMEEQAEAAMIAREYSAGYVTPPDDAEALAAVIRRARQEPRELARMGERGRKAAEAHFDRRTSVRKFAALLRNVVMGEASEPAVMPPGILPLRTLARRARTKARNWWAGDSSRVEVRDPCGACGGNRLPPDAARARPGAAIGCN
jgi:plasmid stabilization system protein ParE